MELWATICKAMNDDLSTSSKFWGKKSNDRKSVDQLVLEQRFVNVVLQDRVLSCSSEPVFIL